MENINELLDDTCLRILGATDGFRDNKNLTTCGCGHNYDLSSRDFLFFDTVGVEIDKNSCAYTEGYNAFYSVGLEDLAALIEQMKEVVGDKLTFLKEHFSEYVFCANQELMQYKINSEKKIYYSENLLEKLEERVECCLENAQLDNEDGFDK